MAKKMYLVRNQAQGIDLVIERDSGNEVRVLMGKPENALKCWSRLRSLCDGALLSLGDDLKAKKDWEIYREEQGELFPEF